MTEGDVTLVLTFLTSGVLVGVVAAWIDQVVSSVRR